MPSVRRPSNAWLACCWAVSLSIGAFGRAASAPVIFCDCQMKSWRRLPSFFVRRRYLACSTTSRKSATKSRPSAESFWDGVARGLDFKKLFSAMSICSFWNILAANPSNGPQLLMKLQQQMVELTDGTLPAWKASKSDRQYCTAQKCPKMPTSENSIKLEFAINILLLGLDVCRSVDLRRHDDERREAWVSPRREGIGLPSLGAARGLSYVCMFW